MATLRETSIHLVNDDIIEERMDFVQSHTIVRVESAVEAARQQMFDIGLNANDPAITREWNALIEIQNRLSANERTLCCCGCASPEMMLSWMIIFWVVIAFYEGIRDYDVKHVEAIVVYAIAFCAFAALVAGQLRFFLAAGLTCFLELVWNIIVMGALVRVQAERRQDAAPEFSIYLMKKWPDLHNYVLRMIDEDLAGYTFVYCMKLIFIIAVLVNMTQVRFTQTLEAELRARRRRIGYLMGEQRSHRDAGLPSFASEPLNAGAFTPIASIATALRMSSVTLTTCTAGHSECALPLDDSVSLTSTIESANRSPYSTYGDSSDC